MPFEGATKFTREFGVECRAFVGEGVFSLVYSFSDFRFPGAVTKIVIFCLVLEGAREMDLHQLEVLTGGFGWRR